MTNETSEKPFNAKAYGLWSLGCASLLSYRYFMPKSVAGVASPGVVAVKALSLATLLSVGTFATGLGALAAYLDVSSIAEFSAVARSRAPGALKALGYERRVAAPSPEAEAEWQAIDATIRAAWDAGDWSKFDEGVRASFGLYFKDDAAAAPADDAAGGRPKS